MNVNAYIMVFPPDLLNFVFDLSSNRSHYGRGNHFDYDHAHHVHDLITYIIRRAQAAIVKAAEQLLGNSSSSFPPPSEASSDSWDEFKYKTSSFCYFWNFYINM